MVKMIYLIFLLVLKLTVLKKRGELLTPSFELASRCPLSSSPICFRFTDCSHANLTPLTENGIKINGLQREKQKSLERWPGNFHV